MRTAILLLLLPACTKTTDDTAATTPAATSVALTTWTDPDPAVAGEDATVWMQFTDQNGNPVPDMQESHERMVHAVFISQDLTSFEHRHQEDTTPITDEDIATSTFHLTEAFPYSGKFLMGFDYAWNNQFLQTTVDEEVSGDIPQLDAPSEELSTTSTDRDVTGTISFKYDPVASLTDEIDLHLVDSTGADITDIVPWLGADAHCFFVTDDLSWFAHSHAYIDGMNSMLPSDTMPHTYDGPDIPFQYAFPYGTTYKMWVQFARSAAPDVPYTLSFVFQVSP